MSLETQRQVRENVCETRTYVEELHQWQREVRKRDAELRRVKPSTSVSLRRRPVAEMELSASIAKTDDVTSPMHHHDHHSTTLTSNDAATNEAEKRRSLGNDAYRGGDYARAVRLYTESLQFEPTSVSYANRAMAHLKRQSFVLAEADCDAALELDPNFVKAYQRRSVARKEQGKAEEALHDAEMALRYLPTSDTIRSTFHDLLSEILQSENLPQPNPAPRPIPILNPDPAPTDPPTTKTDPHVTTPVQQGDVDSEVLVGSVERKVALPCVPKTWPEFEAAYKSLKNHRAWFRDYLAAIPPSTLASLFKASLTAPILAAILEAILSGLSQSSSSDKWKPFAVHLPSVPRYDMLLMCLTTKQKASLKDQARQLSEALQNELVSFLKPFLTL